MGISTLSGGIQFLLITYLMTKYHTKRFTGPTKSWIFLTYSSTINFNFLFKTFELTLSKLFCRKKNQLKQKTLTLSIWWILKVIWLCLKLVSTIFYQIFIFNQMIPCQKLWKMFFISSKKLFSFLRYSIFCNFFPSLPHYPDSKGQMEME